MEKEIKFYEVRRGKLEVGKIELRTSNFNLRII